MLTEMFVRVSFAHRKLGVPLVQLDPVQPDKATRKQQLADDEFGLVARIAAQNYDIARA